MLEPGCFGLYIKTNECTDMDLPYMFDDITKNDLRLFHGDTIFGLTTLGSYNYFGIAACYSRATQNTNT